MGNYTPNTGTTILLAEELEDRLIEEAINYKHVLSDRWETLEFDQEYFRKFIPGTLYTEFIHSLYDRIRPLNNNEISRYLTLSVAQFETYQPEKREKEFIKKYSDAYWAPNIVEKVNEHEERSAKYVLKDFISFYSLFKGATVKALEDIRAGLLVVSNSANSTPENSRDISVNTFFKNIKEGTISQIEIHNTIQKLTGNFDNFKLNLLLEDFEFYLWMAKNKREGECTDEEIDEEIKRLDELGRDIPQRIIYEPVKTETGYKKTDSGSRILDLEKLLFPTEFYFCYQFKGLLKLEIENHPNNADQKGIETNKKKINKFNDLPEQKANFILQMLEDLTLTKNGIAFISKRKKSALLGVVEASLEKGILPPLNAHFICSLIAKKIGLELPSKLGKSFIRDEMRKKAIHYISKNYNA